MTKCALTISEDQIEKLTVCIEELKEKSKKVQAKLDQKSKELQNNTTSTATLEANINQLHETVKLKDVTIADLKDSNSFLLEAAPSYQKKSVGGNRKMVNAIMDDHTYVANKKNTPNTRLNQPKPDQPDQDPSSIHFQINQPRTDHPQDSHKHSHDVPNLRTFTTLLTIPANLIGIIIGKGGWRIRDIQNSCKVNISTQKDKNAHSFHQSLNITGGQQEVARALNTILDHLTCKFYTSGNCNYKDSCRFRHNQHVEIVTVPHNHTQATPSKNIHGTSTLPPPNSITPIKPNTATLINRRPSTSVTCNTAAPFGMSAPTPAVPNILVNQQLQDFIHTTILQIMRNLDTQKK